MMSAYNEGWLYNLAVIKLTKRWCKHNFISKAQLDSISSAYKCPFYHPNFVIRIVLFVATLLALSGVMGLFFVVLGIGDLSDEGVALGSIFFGAVVFFVLERAFIRSNHFKSGVTEALLYSACGYTIGGVLGLVDFNPHIIGVVSLIVFSIVAIRYLDLLSTVAAVGSLAGIVFYECYNMGGFFKQIIPFVFIGLFSAIYLWARNLKEQSALKLWTHNIVIVESASLVLVYVGGNYLVVRELSVAMMGLEIGEGQDIPFAFIFYGLTILIPVFYLWAGIKRKDIVLMRVGLVAIAFSAFTFKYYFSFERPEITLTVAGVILLGISTCLMNYLKTTRAGFTRENLLSEKWGNANLEAFVVSQTMGGNQATSTDQKFKPGGGEFGGGGASGEF